MVIHKQRQFDYSIHYNKYHNHNDAAHRAKIALYVTELLKPVLPIEKSSPILEIGCSNGLGLLALRDMGYSSVKGIDSSQQLIDIARSFDLDVELVDALTYLDSIMGNQFSLIYMIDTLEHISRKSTFHLLSRVFDALLPGGCLFLQVPNADSPIGLHFRYIDWTHNCSFTTESISSLLESAGFREIIITESFPPAKRKLEEFEESEQGRQWLAEEQARCRAQELARKITRWHLSQFFSEAQGFLLTPNINVIAIKKPDTTSFCCQIKRMEHDDDECFNFVDIIDQIKESNWRIRSLQEWNSYLEDRINSNERLNRLRQEELRCDLHKERDRLNKWNEWLENELVRLKTRNILLVLFIDTLRFLWQVICYPFMLARALRYLPSTYEKSVDRQYWHRDQ